MAEKTIDVMVIVPLTASPYAAASRDDRSKASTSTTQASASPWFSAGT
jgi:hypothetical protein